MGEISIKLSNNIENKPILYSDVDSLKFVFYQSEQSLKEVLSITDAIAVRVYSLISLVVVLMVAIVGYIAPKIDSIMDNLPLNIACVASLIYFLFILRKLKNSALPKGYYATGNRPENMLLNSMFSDQITNTVRLCHYYINEIEQYQGKINDGTVANTKRQQSLRITLNLLFLFPILFAILFGLLFYLLPIVGCP